MVIVTYNSALHEGMALKKNNSNKVHIVLYKVAVITLQMNSKVNSNFITYK